MLDQWESSLGAGHLGRGGGSQYLSGFTPDREARSQPRVTVAGAHWVWEGTPSPEKMILQSTFTSVWSALPPAAINRFTCEIVFQPDTETS